MLREGLRALVAVQVSAGTAGDVGPPEIKVGWRMKATISVDHRLSDGAESVQFIQALAKYIEKPLRLLV